MRGSIGLVIGLAVGAGAMYLVLRPPWEHRVTTVASEGPPVVVVPGSDLLMKVTTESDFQRVETLFAAAR